MGGAIGRSRRGGRLGHGDTFVIFFMSRVFFSRREAGEEGKISSDLKKCNATWSL